MGRYIINLIIIPTILSSFTTVKSRQIRRRSLAIRNSFIPYRISRCMTPAITALQPSSHSVLRISFITGNIFRISNLGLLTQHDKGQSTCAERFEACSHLIHCANLVFLSDTYITVKGDNGGLFELSPPFVLENEYWLPMPHHIETSPHSGRLCLEAHLVKADMMNVLAMNDLHFGSKKMIGISLYSLL